jgi:hypothetical protein
LLFEMMGNKWITVSRPTSSSDWETSVVFGMSLSAQHSEQQLREPEATPKAPKSSPPRFSFLKKRSKKPSKSKKFAHTSSSFSSSSSSSLSTSDIAWYLLAQSVIVESEGSWGTSLFGNGGGVVLEKDHKRSNDFITVQEADLVEVLQDPEFVNYSFKFNWKGGTRSYVEIPLLHLALMLGRFTLCQLLLSFSPIDFSMQSRLGFLPSCVAADDAAQQNAKVGDGFPITVNDSIGEQHEWSVFEKGSEAYLKSFVSSASNIQFPSNIPVPEAAKISQKNNRAQIVAKYNISL